MRLSGTRGRTHRSPYAGSHSCHSRALRSLLWQADMTLEEVNYGICHAEQRQKKDSSDGAACKARVRPLRHPQEKDALARKHFSCH